MSKVRDRLREPEARILALRIAASRPRREAETSYIKDRVPDYITLTALDLEPSKTRSGEPVWRQIVGNVVSHEATSTSIFTAGHAEIIPDGIRVTDAGVAYLATLGF
jgi:hypothetical protein